MNLGKSIVIARNKKGLRQNVVADAAGISQTFMSQIENGKKEPSKETVSRIATALDMPVSFLVLASLDDSDIPENKKVLYTSLRPLIDELINNY